MKKKHWSYSVGRYGCRVRVYEHVNGILHAEVRLHGVPPRRFSLRYTDQEAATRWAQQEQARLELGISRQDRPAPTVSRIFALYLAHHSPRKCSEKERRNDDRVATMWKRVLGAGKDLSLLTRREWLDFTDAREKGAVDARGKRYPPSVRQTVGKRTVGKDLEWLRSVLLWACRWQDEDGRFLMRENPARGFPIPKERNPRRPIVTRDLLEVLLQQVRNVKMAAWIDGKRRQVVSYLPELIALAYGTGRRISPILGLRACDLDLRSTDARPYGGIKWPGDLDKQGKAWFAPIGPEVRVAVDAILQRRPIIGRAYLFPSPRNKRLPVSKDLASAWLEKCYDLAEIPKPEQGAWHPFRRMWATERKHWPIQDVMAAGGWSDPTSLQTVYQQADDETLYRVVTEPHELREVKKG